NFFSKDSIQDYDFPKPIRVGLEVVGGETTLFIYGLDEIGYEFRLAKVFQDPTNQDNYFIFIDNTDELLTDYWSRLSKQAVLHGAGVVKLFFDEVAREKETKVLYNKNKTWAQKIFDATKNTIFNVASVFYGSSVTLEDLDDPEGDLAVKPPSGQEAAVAAPIVVASERVEGAEVGEGEEGTEGVVQGNEATLELTPEVVLPNKPDTGIRDRFGLVALPSGGGAVGGGGSQSTLAQDTTPPALPAITTPANFSATFVQDTITFSGTAEAGSIISQNFNSSTTAALETGLWSLTLFFSQGSTTIQFFATDSAGNTSKPAEISIFVDSIAPDLNFNIAECGNSLTAGCLSTSTTATLSWSSSAQDIANYELDCAIGETVCAGFPKNFLATSSVTAHEALLDYSAHTFTLKIFDNSGNQAQILRSIETASRPVVINEIAWMGTASSSADEWIELKNNTSQEISFANWILRADDNTPYMPLGDSIPANGYFILERTDDNTISDISADQIYGNDGASWALNNSGERLFLERIFENATTTVDEVIKCNNWCGKGDNDSKQTMERINSRIAGTETGNWGTALGKWPEELLLLNGKGADGGPIKGTPKEKNSITHLIARDTLSVDKTLTKENSPYVVPREGLNISAGTTLTINPGSVVKIIGSNNSRIIVNGTIKSNGEADDQVVFTSFADDEYGGDTNRDGICNTQDASSTAGCPVPGSWMQILVNSTSQNSSFTNTIIRYGGSWSTNSGIPSMVAVNGADATFNNVTIEYPKKHGLYLTNSSGAVSNSTFKYDSGKFPYYLGFPPNDSDAAGLFVGGGGMPVIDNNTFQGFRYGLYGNTAGASISGNVLNNNIVSAIQANNAVGYFSNNSGSGNGLNGIVIGNSYNIASLGATTTLGANSLPYIIKGEANVASDSVLTFEPGVVLKGHNSNANNTGRLVVKKDGKIYFNGSSPSDLIFTSTEDNSVGGNVFGTSTIPGDGSWYGIVVEKGGVFAMRGFTLR
ncbi:MAG: lamin tail domain-containing protein, partial [Parcubacteria group bacterium]|nr:lamin tail domain-containing protein [Parcubacteria group bacterium]